MKTINPNQEALDIQKKIEKLDKKIMKLEFAKNDHRRRLETICIHNETEKEYIYHPGGYLERCEYINRTICKVCGIVLDEEKTFGGFN